MVRYLPIRLASRPPSRPRNAVVPGIDLKSWWQENAKAFDEAEATSCVK